MIAASRVRRLSVGLVAIAASSCGVAPVSTTQFPEMGAPKVAVFDSEPPQPAAVIDDRSRRLHERAQVLEREARFLEAIALWEAQKLLEPNSNRYDAAIARARVWNANAVAERLRAADAARSAGNSTEAITQFWRVLRVDPDNERARSALRALEAERARRGTINLIARAGPAVSSPEPASTKPAAPRAGEALRDLDVGVMSLRQGDHAGSIQILERHLKERKDDPVARAHLAEAHHQLGQVTLAKGNREEALGQFERSLAYGPRDKPAVASAIRSLRQTLGEEYYRQGMQAYGTDLKRAIELWERSRKFDPNHTQAAIRLEAAKKAANTLRLISGPPK